MTSKAAGISWIKPKKIANNTGRGISTGKSIRVTEQRDNNPEQVNAQQHRTQQMRIIGRQEQPVANAGGDGDG